MWLSIAKLIESTNFMIADVICWKKRSALPNNQSHNKLTRITEFVFVICRKSEYNTFHTNKKVKCQSNIGQNFYENIFNFIEASNNDGSVELNKATYSSELVFKLLQIYASKDATVYDPFMGTGTTAIGCMRYSDDITCIGSELSEKQTLYARERIDNFSITKQLQVIESSQPKQPSLFDNF